MASQPNPRTSTEWYFTKEQLENTPSRQCGVEPHKELSYRQQAANFIQEMGQKLNVSLLCINTAIVYMHRFYVFHSFTHFPWNSIAAAALFLAAKVEEQPRKLEHVIRAVNYCKKLDNANSAIDTTSEKYLAQSQDLVYNENILLQTLGFEVAIDHPHTHVVRCCHLVRASKDLAQTSYIIASNSLHLTTMCLQYKPTVVACFCIHFVCKWANWEIPLSNEKKEWFSYVDETVTSELLEQLAKEFLAIYERCPSRLKEKIMAISEGVSLPYNSSHPSPFESDKKFTSFPSMSDQKDIHGHRSHHGDPKTGPLRLPHEPSSSGQHRDREREYREKRDRDRMAHHIKPLQPGSSSGSGKHGQPVHTHHGHVPSIDPKFTKHMRMSSSAHPSNPKTEPRDILREATRDIGLNDYKSSSSNSREVNQQVRGDKRDFVHQRQAEVKPSNSATDSSSSSAGSSNYSADKRVDPSARPRQIVDPKLQARRRDEPKLYNNKLENDIKKHLSAAVHDKNSFLQKPINSTSQKSKSPFTDIPKTIAHANQSLLIPKTEIKTEIKVENQHSNLSTTHDFKVKVENLHHDQSVVGLVVPNKKPPGVFSPPEVNLAVQKKSKAKSPSPNLGKKSIESSLNSSVLQNNIELPNHNVKRNRTSSTNSEPELRPVMKKIDHVQGFENIVRDTSIGIKSHQVPDMITPITDTKQDKIECSISKELKPPDLILPFNSNVPIINGIETNPTLISTLLKETPTVSTHLPATINTTVTTNTTTTTTVIENETKKKDQNHREHKKNKKEKHKHKDKEKNREEKEKKKKHKEKDRDKHKHKHEKHDLSNDLPTQSLKIYIHKDKIQSNDVPPPQTGGIKIKIPKDRIKTDGIGESSSNVGSGLKIKISKESINLFQHDNSKKREYDRNSSLEVPPTKISKSSYTRYNNDVKSGRNSFNKVRPNNSNVYNVQQPNFNGANRMNQPPPPPYYQQNAAPNYYFNYPPPNMPTMLPPQNSINIPPSFVYQQFFPPQPGYMYTPDMYMNALPQQMNVPPLPVDPPLPVEPPPLAPPPPPPSNF